MPPQFFLPPEAVTDKTFHLTGPEAFHISKVLRYREGQSLILFDGKGGRFEATIVKIHPDGSVSGDVTATLTSSETHAAVKLTVYQGLLKGGHWELVLEKGTEIGVSTFVPVLTPRTVVLMKEVERAKNKVERWKKIIFAATKQCGRGDLPELRSPVQFRDAIKEGQGNGLTLLAWEGLSGATAAESLRGSLREAVEKKTGKEPMEVRLFIGPEGGFSEEEVELAESVGAIVFGLGPKTLRAETAAITAASIVLYEFGSL